MSKDYFHHNEEDKAIMDRDAYEQGKQAYHNGERLGECPNFEHSDRGKRLREMWRRGWTTAKHEKEISDFQNSDHE